MKKQLSPSEQAKRLIENFKEYSYEDYEGKFQDIGTRDESSKQCALLYVNGMIDEFQISKFPIGGNEQDMTLYYYKAERYQYWLSVKRKLEKK